MSLLAIVLPLAINTHADTDRNIHTHVHTKTNMVIKLIIIARLQLPEEDANLIHRYGHCYLLPASHLHHQLMDNQLTCIL